MAKIHKKVLIFTFILFVGTPTIPGIVFADLPWLDIQGDFTYDYSHRYKGQTVYDYTLTFSNWDITGGNYASGANFNDGDDPITLAWIEISGSTVIDTLYNDASPNNLTFNSDSGPMTFTIKDATTAWMTATLANFYVNDVPLFPPFNMTPTTQLNKSQNDNNITNVVFTSDTSSQYINEMRNSVAPFNLSWEFTFTGGANAPYGDGTAFTEDSSGTFSGKLYAGPEVPVVPEPISSVLFITGGATLAMRSYFRRRNASN